MENKTIKAQELLNIVEREENKREGYLRMFYPSLHNLKLADQNLSKCLKELK